jgi:hypothetical protein
MHNLLAHSLITFELQYTFRLDAPKDPHFGTVWYKITKMGRPWALILHGAIGYRRVSGYTELFTPQEGPFTRLPEFAELLPFDRFHHIYYPRWRKDSGLRPGAPAPPELGQEAYRRLACAYEEFTELVLPSPGHAELYGSGDDSYEDVV